MTTLKSFEEHLSGGLEHGKWHYVVREGEIPEGYDETDWPRHMAVLFFMDGEYDLVRVTYDFDGYVRINADGHKWFCFKAETLRWLSIKVDEVTAEMDKYFAGEKSKVTKGWGKYHEGIFEDD